MAIFATENPLTFILGFLGNVASSIVFLAPVRTFYRIYKEKSTDKFHPIARVVSLFGAMLWVYYASVKANSFYPININAFGCFMEIIYLGIYIACAPKNETKFAMTMLLYMIFFGGFCIILLLSHFLVKGANRVTAVGWVCVAFSVSAFAVPLKDMRLVIISTNRVEFMPFPLSLILTINAAMWFFYGLFLKDYYIAVPNILGLGIDAAQMILYFINQSKEPLNTEQPKEPEDSIGMEN